MSRSRPSTAEAVIAELRAHAEEDVIRDPDGILPTALEAGGQWHHHPLPRT
jgi:hypothetical protein